MKRGEWVLAQPLMFDVTGRLLNGQHSLLAVIDSGVTCEFLVIRGYPAGSTFGRIDDVDPRSVADWFHQEGVMYPGVAASVVKMCHRMLTGRNAFASGGAKLSGPAALDFLDDHPEIRDAVSNGPGTVNPLLSRAICCYLYMEFRKKDKALADLFFVDFTDGKRTGNSDPIWLLRDRMIRNKSAKEKLTRKETAAIVIKAWNAEVNDRPLSNLKWQSSGNRPEKFPVIEGGKKKS